MPTYLPHPHGLYTYIKNYGKWLHKITFESVLLPSICHSGFSAPFWGIFSGKNSVVLLIALFLIVTELYRLAIYISVNIADLKIEFVC